MKTFHIFVIGCQMNKSDSERIDAYLGGLGLTATDKPEAADLVILVTCGVRQSAEDRVFGLIPKWKRARPAMKVVLTGCLALRPDVRQRLGEQVDVWLAIYDLPSLATELGLAPVAETGYNSLSYLAVQPHYQSTYSAFVPIGNGCNNFCSYCVVPYARGREVYRPHQEIVAEVRALLARGYKEITLIAQNVNSYRSLTEQGQSLDFADLLAMVDALEGDWWLRFATSHPKDMSEKLIQTVAAGRHTCQYFHFAAQSGDDEILRLMNRRYTAEHYLSLVELIRRHSPEAMISTDIIVGFPSETDEQFNNTKQLLTAARFDMVYIAQYSPRPGTASAKMTDDVPKAEKKRREDELNELLAQTALANNQRLLGRRERVLVDELKQRAGQYWASGKTASFKTVRFPVLAAVQPGDFVTVEISAVSAFGLEAKQLCQDC